MNTIQYNYYIPISLLSVFYKMATSVITRRLETVMEGMIWRQQKAYSTERNIWSGLINLLNMVQLSKQKRLANLILCVDFKKAFDSIDHNFIKSTLKLSFRGSFNLCGEILLLNITKTDRLDGATCTKKKARCKAYAGDSTILIKRTEQNLVQIIKDFAKISSLHAHLEKTFNIPIGSHTRTAPEYQLCRYLKLNLTKFFTLLNFEFERDSTAEMKVWQLFSKGRFTNI